jgi:predicted DNA-binding protein YlxM (UPF0122 family)
VLNVAEAVQQESHRYDITSAEEASAAFGDAKNKLFFEPGKGYFSTQGRNAVDGADTANKSLDKMKQQYGESLSPNARAMYDRSVDAQISRSRVDIARHASDGLKAWETFTLHSQVENTIENASLYWNQPDKLGVQNALGRHAVRDGAEMEGVGAEATNERLQTYDSSFARAVIESAIASSAKDGSAMLDKYGDRLEGAEKTKFKKEVYAKAAAEKLQANAQQAVASGVTLVATYDSREDIREEVNKIDDTDLRKKTMSEAMRQFDLKKKGESEDQARSFESAESHIEEGGSAETFQATDPEGWARLSVGEKKTIKAGKVVTTNGAKFMSLLMLPKEELAKVNPAEHYKDIARSERGKLVSAVKSARGTGSPIDNMHHQIGRTTSAQTIAALEQMFGEKKKDWSDAQIKSTNSFYDLLSGEVAFREEQKGGTLSSQEFTDTLADLTRQVTVVDKGFFFDSDEDLNVFGAETDDDDVEGMSAEDARLIRDHLHARGVRVTAESLVKVYRALEAKRKRDKDD